MFVREVKKASGKLLIISISVADCCIHKLSVAASVLARRKGRRLVARIEAMNFPTPGSSGGTPAATCTDKQWMRVAALD